MIIFSLLVSGFVGFDRFVDIFLYVGLIFSEIRCEVRLVFPDHIGDFRVAVIESYLIRIGQRIENYITSDPIRCRGYSSVEHDVVCGTTVETDSNSATRLNSGAKIEAGDR